MGPAQNGPQGSGAHGEELPGIGLHYEEQGAWESAQSSGGMEHKGTAEPKSSGGKGACLCVSAFAYSSSQQASMTYPLEGGRRPSVVRVAHLPP